MNDSTAIRAARFESQWFTGSDRVKNRALAARTTLLLIPFFLQGPLSLFANGGAFYRTVIERTGNLVPIQKPLVSLEEETLNAYIDRDDVGVHVLTSWRTAAPPILSPLGSRWISPRAAS